MVSLKFYNWTNSKDVYIRIVDNYEEYSNTNQKLVAIEPQICSEDDKQHLLHIRQIGNFVTVMVGEEPHVMVEIHHINLILIETNQGIQYKYLLPNTKPIADFLVGNDEEVLNVYGYCNIHGLYMLKVK